MAQYACTHCHRRVVLLRKDIVEWVCQGCGLRVYMPADQGVHVDVPEVQLLLARAHDQLETMRHEMIEAKNRKDWETVAEVNGYIAALEELIPDLEEQSREDG